MMDSIIETVLKRVLKEKCPECYCSLVCNGQYHNCSVTEEDEGFEDGLTMELIVQKYEEGDISDSDLELVSTVVSRATFYTMASSCKTRAQKNSILTLEFLYTIRNKRAIQRFYGGSEAEGTNLPDSDIDKMIVFPNITVCRDRQRACAVKGVVFLTDTSNCRPGYTKLVLVKLDANERTVFDDHGKTIEEMLDKSDDGKLFLSSDKIVQFWMNFLTKRNISSTTPEYRHGPCATAVNEDTHGNISGKVGVNIEQDFAHALVFDEWPVDADEWFCRKRENGWPSLEIIEKIKKLKCHVAVGDQMSTTSAVEWRVSYLLGERELIWNFNDVQLQCYILLKKLLRQIINPAAPGELSSYHMKTIVFWKSETSRPDVWQQKHLLKCIRNCLVHLKACVENSSLEHYIDRRKNLLSGKLKNGRMKDKVIECIDEVVQNIVPCVLRCIDGIELLSVWLDSNNNASEFHQLCQDGKDTRITKSFDEFKLPLEHYHMGMTAFGVNVETVLADFSTLALYHEAFDRQGPEEDIDHQFSKTVRMYVNIRIALTLMKRFIDKNEPTARQKLEKLRKLLEENVEIDALSGKLYLATYLLRIESYKEVLAIVQTILYSGFKSLVYTGQCSKLQNIVVANGSVTQRKRLPNRSNSNAMYLSMAHDILFSKEDVSFLPYAMKFESMLDRGILLHPVVYMFYLAVLSCHNETEVNEFMKRLEVVVGECKGSLQDYRHLNILGCCYFLRSDYSKALDCYTNSLSQTLSTKRQNAAAYHLIIMIFHLLHGEGLRRNAECIYQQKPSQ